MNSKTVIGVVVVLLVLAGGYYFLQLQSVQKEPSATKNTPASQSPIAPVEEEKVIEITSAGFSPASITVSVGTTVRFVNKDFQLHWPASGVHPTHQVCAGLDALRPVNPEESYSFKFSVAKTCPIHDHLNPVTKGSIVVQ